MFYFNYGFMPMMSFTGMGFYPSYQTGQPNYSLWASNPCRKLGNFGGTYQFSTYPVEYSLQDVFACQNAANPFFYSNYFLNTFMSMMSQYPGVQQEQNLAQTAAMGRQMGLSAGLNIGISSATNSLSSLKYQVEQALGRTDLTDEQKQNLELCRKQIELLEQRMEQLKEDKATQSRTYEELSQTLQNINASTIEISRLKEQILRKADFVDEEENEQTEQVQQNQETEQAQQTQQTEQEQQTQQTEQTQQSQAAAQAQQNAQAGQGQQNAQAGQAQQQAQQATGGTQLKASAAEQQQNEKLKYRHALSYRDENMYAADVKDEKVAEIANKLYDLIDGVNANDGEIIDFVSDNINKDNVVDVILYWNEHCSEKFKKDDENGIIESIMDEFVYLSKDKAKAVNPIVIALNEHIEDLEKQPGVNKDKIKAAKDALKNLDCLNSTADHVAKSVNKAHRAIVEIRMEQEKA